MAEERWADVPGFEGIYQVSDHGRVRSLPRVTCDGRRINGRLMKGTVVAHGGHRQVKLMRGGEYKCMYVSRLVAEAFVPNPGLLRSVLHKNGDPLDDRAENLYWADQPTNSAERWSEERSVAVTRGDGKSYGSMTDAALDMRVAGASIRCAEVSGGTCLQQTFDREGGRKRAAGSWQRGHRVERVEADGAKLKRIMTAARVTVKELAAESGVSETKIWTIRSGRALPTPSELQRIADALGIGADALML